MCFCESDYYLKFISSSKIALNGGKDSLTYQTLFILFNFIKLNLLHNSIKYIYFTFIVKINLSISINGFNFFFQSAIPINYNEF